MNSSHNVNLNSGIQGANISNSTVTVQGNITFNINQPKHQIGKGFATPMASITLLPDVDLPQHSSQADKYLANKAMTDPISKSFVKYKKWISEEKEHSIVRKKLKQLSIDGKICQIKRKLKGNEGEFSEAELLNRIPHGVTSLVTGSAGSGKSTLAASTLVNWAESEESRYDLVLFFSSLHKVGDLPLHKQIWGEYAGKIREQESSKIYEELKENTAKILVIIDGIGILKYQHFIIK